MEHVLDYLGYQLVVGERAIRVHVYSHNKMFKKVIIKKIDCEKKSSVGIITDGNSKIGWTYPERLISERAFKDKI